MSRRHVITPKRPAIAAFNGLIDTGKRALSDLSKKRRDQAFAYVSGKDHTVSAAQQVKNVQHAVQELESAEAQTLTAAKDFRLAAAVLKGDDPDIHMSTDEWQLLDCAHTVRGFADEQLEALPDYDLSEVSDLADQCIEVADKLERDAEVCRQRRAKTEDFLATLVLNALCDDDTTEAEFEDIRLNTKEGQRVFSEYVPQHSDFDDEWRNGHKEPVALNDQAGGLRFLHIRMADGQLLDKSTFKRLRVREAKRMVAKVAKEEAEARLKDRRKSGERDDLQNIKSKLSGVWQ